ncbi:MAG TPA: lactate permease LctP family transporter [Methylomusa anaerophila]|uniref:L-lactate permease n=1 Tax=Methylomusa anaerophila TaxID=1930071 RepID=A0A348AFR9_9FIRM|nr:lactate permease LctP family transporter [Methylomusa anaerophila]BBB89917.1 L-lactate permease [Methylomusa anaerophila]HML88357.1 lactate permease LctP family transporter [Methylomusa anaerophila]
MAWVQVYNPLNSISLSALAAAMPLFVLLYMLGIRKSRGHYAAAAGLLITIILAVAVWRMPVELAVSATLNGAMFGIFPIVWIIIPTIWLYSMIIESGEFEIIKNSLASITDDRRLQALLIAFAFGAFIEGAAGYGTPVAITAAMLVGLGFNPLYAAGICLIANVAPVAFGAIGIPIVVAAQITSLDVMTVSKIVGRQIPLLSLLAPWWIVVTMCGWKRAIEVLPAVLVTGVSFAVTQFFISNYFNPFLPDIIAAVVTILSLLVLLKIWRPKRIWRFRDEKFSESDKVELLYSRSEIIRAWMPYFILIFFVFLWADDKIFGLKTILSSLDSNTPLAAISWPYLDGRVIETMPVTAENTPLAAKYALNILSATGTSIFLAGLVSLLIIPDYGLARATRCFIKTVKQLAYPICTIAMILALAYVTNYSGMSYTLGLAFTATGAFFPFFSPILGWLGVFLTGSDSSANALFSTMQKTTAEQIHLDPSLTVAANASGGVTGKMISPQSISVATAAAGIAGREGHIFRFTLGHSVAMCLIIAVLVYLQAHVLSWMLP